MQLQRLWSGFTNEQYNYITNIIKNSDAKSVCELGTFVGTTAKNIWEHIKDSDKKLYHVDNYLFLQEDKRQKFFDSVKHSIDKNTQNISEQIKEIRQKTIYNIGGSAHIGSEYIRQLHNKSKD